MRPDRACFPRVSGLVCRHHPYMPVLRSGSCECRHPRVTEPATSDGSAARIGRVAWNVALAGLRRMTTLSRQPQIAACLGAGRAFHHVTKSAPKPTVYC